MDRELLKLLLKEELSQEELFAGKPRDRVTGTAPVLIKGSNMIGLDAIVDALNAMLKGKGAQKGG